MQNTTYDIDWASVVREFPPHQRPPRLLAQFAEFLRTQPDGGLGSFAIAGERMGDGAMPGGDGVAEQFALFCRLGDGSCVGFWFPAGAGEGEGDATLTGYAPIVLIAHDEYPSFIAPSLPEFLWRIADANIDGSSIPWDFQPDPEDEEAIDARPALKSWLHTAAPRAQVDPAVEAALSAGFDRFIESSTSDFQQSVNENPLWQEISQILQPYWTVWMEVGLLFKQLNEPWLKDACDGLKPHLKPEDQAHLPEYSDEDIGNLMQQFKGQKMPKVELIEISAAGGLVQVTRLHQGEKILLLESERIAPLILQLRVQQVKLVPERGLWHFALLTLGEKGEVELSRASCAWPQFASKQLQAKTAELVSADLAKHPRSDYWQLGPQT